MLNGVLNFRRDARNVAEEKAAYPKRDRTARGRGRVRPEDLAPTQDCVMVTAARDNILILRDYSVVAAVGLGSMSHTILDANALQAKLGAYRLMLKYVRFDFQFLIGTRPQNLNTYHAKLSARLKRIGQMQSLVDRLALHLPMYVQNYSVEATEARIKACRKAAEQHKDTSLRYDPETHFIAQFGFRLSDLYGVPGKAHEVASDLANPFKMAKLKDEPAETQNKHIQTWIQQCDASNHKLDHWRDIVQDRDDQVEAVVISAKAPVRTFTLVTSFNPRPLGATSKTPLTDSELKRATAELDRRCVQLQDGISQMGLPAWRLPHDELLEEIRYFFHPGTGRREHTLSRERSVGMRLASVR